jgi:hypothetical protein
MRNKIFISRWIGQFGNNLEQIAASIVFAKCIDGNTKLDIPSQNLYENLLNTKKELYFDKEYVYDVKDFESIDWLTNSYYSPASLYVKDDYKDFLIDKILDVFRNEIKSMINIFHFEVVDSINEKTLTVHLRGGDIIRDVHPLYKQKIVPWEFYSNIIDSEKYDKVIICREDDLNPFYNKIVEHCKFKGMQIDDRKRNLIEDYYILLNSHNLLVSGFSTFSLTSSYINKKLKNFYYPMFSKEFESEYMRLKVLDTTDCDLHLYDKNNSLVNLY